MKNLSRKKENTIKIIRNRFKLEKETIKIFLKNIINQ